MSPYGPRLLGDSHHDIESAAMEASVSLMLNDALVMLAWSDACESHKWTPAVDTGEDANGRRSAELPHIFPRDGARPNGVEDTVV